MTDQIKLSEKQLDAFNVEGYSNTQANHLIDLLRLNGVADRVFQVVDIGGGYGYFASALSRIKNWPIRVIDSDIRAIAYCSNNLSGNIKALLGDALTPNIIGDEEIICFNLILHHLIGKNETETRRLQKKALLEWNKQVKYIFINEYIYESYIGYVSGRLIYEITKSKVLSFVGKYVAEIIPSFRANTFGVGVRFRSHNEWLELFEECGFKVVETKIGPNEITSIPLRALIIRNVRRDSFLLSPKCL
jgi:SAM-dependent methyltransferase